MILSLEQHIESLLFYKAEPLNHATIARILDVDIESIAPALILLKEQLQGRGIVLIEQGDKVSLATHPEMSHMLDRVRTEELSTPLSKAALETLTIIAYKNGVTKHELDYIRGVNSQFMIRNLLIRGLIERVSNPEDKRSPRYQLSLDTIAFMGVTAPEELPEFHTVKSRIEKALNDDISADEDADEDNTDIPHNESLPQEN